MDNITARLRFALTPSNIFDISSISDQINHVICAVDDERQPASLDERRIVDDEAADGVPDDKFIVSVNTRLWTSLSREACQRSTSVLVNHTITTSRSTVWLLTYLLTASSSQSPERHELFFDKYFTRLGNETPYNVTNSTRWLLLRFTTEISTPHTLQTCASDIIVSSIGVAALPQWLRVKRCYPTAVAINCIG